MCYFETGGSSIWKHIMGETLSDVSYIFGQFELNSCQKENFFIISFITKKYLLYLIQQLPLRGNLFKVALRSGERGVFKQKNNFLQNSAFFRMSPEMYGFVLKNFQKGIFWNTVYFLTCKKDDCTIFVLWLLVHAIINFLSIIYFLLPLHGPNIFLLPSFPFFSWNSNTSSPQQRSHIMLKSFALFLWFSITNI